MERDLTTADRDALLAIIAEHEALLAREQATTTEQQVTIAALQSTIAELQKRIAALERRLSGGGSSGMPGNKPATGKPATRKTDAKKKRPHGFARVRMVPTEQVEHAVDACPDCGTHLFGGWVQRTREVIEIPMVPVRVIAHVFVARECPVCGKRCIPTEEVLEGAVVGQQRLGVSLVSVIATLREEGRLPYRTIQWLLETYYGLHVSVGGLVAVIHGVARQAKQAVDQIREDIRGSPVVHGDETGWRQDGENGYVWTFSTPTQRYFVRRGRNKEVVDEVLGESFDGVLVSDFYAAYDHYPGLHQRCWAHLLRDIHALCAVYPDDAGLEGWAAAVHTLYHEAKAFAHPDERVRERQRLKVEKHLLQACRPFVDDPLAVQARLCRRIHRFIRELFLFVQYPEVPSENNAAERSLRHLVTSRKISGGTRGDNGTESKMILSSLFGTWRAMSLNPFEQCCQLLRSPAKSPSL